MLRRYKTLPPFLAGIILRQQSIRPLGTKPSRCRYPTNAVSDEEKIRKAEENQDKNIYLMKSMGQHLLTNQRILDSIVGRSDIKPTDTVLEIGPGTGNLTLKLLQVSNRVVAVEVDERMVEILNKRVAELGLQDRLTVICADALKTEFPPFDIVVANIPYNISSPLVAKLVYGSNPFRSATLLLQKEYARRLLANPGDSEFNRLAVNVKLKAEVEFVMDVSKRNFCPCPKVDSSVVIIRPKAQVPDVNQDEWLAFTRTCFTKKNKTLGATFKHKRKLVELLKLSDATSSQSEHIVKSCNDEEMDSDQEDATSSQSEHIVIGCNDEEMDSDQEDCISSSSSETGTSLSLSLFKDKIIGVLKSGGYEDKRPVKLSNEELLHLLSLFNQAGIFFHVRAETEPVREGNAAFSASYSS